MRDPVIASFWTGSKLTFLEQLCLKSFADHGHRTVLYSYDPALNVPPGVELADAAEIVPDPAIYRHKAGFAPFSDMFRLNMIAETGSVWVDCDVAALRPMPDLPYLFARAGRFYGNAILRLPASSPALRQLLELVNADEPLLPAGWRWKHFLPEELRAQAASDGSIRLDQSVRATLPYMTFGPHALTYFLTETGEDRYELPTELFYPAHPVAMRGNYFRPNRSRIRLPDAAVALHHVGGKPFRKKFERMPDFVPPAPTSLIALLCQRHGIDPMAAPAACGAESDTSALAPAA